jgi:predicted DCC family thiol-disulfide oxidoreductase YuxK
MPPVLFMIVWALMALGYGFSGYTKLVSPSWLDGRALGYVLESPLARQGPLRDLMRVMPAVTLRVLTYGTLGLELAFLPLALFSRTRPWIWAALLGLHLGLIGLVSFADLSLGMVFLHLFTFDPGWIPPLPSGGGEHVFFDGDCGLCHRTVRFVLSEDQEGTFRFAPLKGPTFEQRTGLPTVGETVVVQTGEGVLLFRSQAVRYLLLRLGGLWRLVGGLIGLVPRAFRDNLYDGVALVRHRLFPQPSEACPVGLPALRARFDP